MHDGNIGHFHRFHAEQMIPPQPGTSGEIPPDLKTPGEIPPNSETPNYTPRTFKKPPETPLKQKPVLPGVNPTNLINA
jgi:hypothetical protein